MARYPTAERMQILAQTRSRLLKAALAEFAQTGFAAANTERISIAADLAKGTLYNYFPSKRALMESLIAECAARHVAYITERVMAAAEPVERLRVFYRAGFDFVIDFLDEARFLLATLNSPEQDFNARLYTAYLPLFDLAAQQILIPGAAAGVFRPTPPESTAALLMTLYLGSAASVDPSGKPFMDPQNVADFALAALEPRAGMDKLKGTEE